VLDTYIFSSIIYILYEGGWLRPPVVRTTCRWATLSNHRSRRRNGEEDREEGRQEEGREEAVDPLGGCHHAPPLRFRSQISRIDGSEHRGEGHPAVAGQRARRQRPSAGADRSLAHTRPEERGDTEHGEESSQGRKEEGSQEAVAELSVKSTRGRSLNAPFFLYTNTCNDDWRLTADDAA